MLYRFLLLLFIAPALAVPTPVQALSDMKRFVEAQKFIKNPSQEELIQYSSELRDDFSQIFTALLNNNNKDDTAKIYLQFQENLSFDIIYSSCDVDTKALHLAQKCLYAGIAAALNLEEGILSQDNTYWQNWVSSLTAEQLCTDLLYETLAADMMS